LVEGLSHKVIIEVACGGSHTIACSEDGEAFAWGDASKGALGIGTNDGLEA
jgi:alpha-tubulin suppressor-like RCC1 family protein